MRLDGEDFVDGEWYVHIGRGRMLAHFYQRRTGGGTFARTSCGMGHEVGLLQPNDTSPDKRAECQVCWRSECAKARRS